MSTEGFGFLRNLVTYVGSKEKIDVDENREKENGPRIVSLTWHEMRLSTDCLLTLSLISNGRLRVYLAKQS